ncbi:winged helix-turn-helix domain-containing protein [Micromonospora sp. NPDC048986]|uniref:winged helix-turn-helix domain-containing protein n=1 Tax=Micromonospora sp. NPDC048986 TaxID=3155644 RepID=UPI0033D590AD
MALTPQSQLRLWLIQTLGDLGGSAERRLALRAMAKAFQDQFTDDDWRSPPKRPFESNWENRTSFERGEMVREGLLLPMQKAGRGRWALTERGWTLHRQVSR